MRGTVIRERVGGNLEVTTSNNGGYTSKHIANQESTLPLAAPVMVAKTAPYPPGGGFREIPAGQHP